MATARAHPAERAAAALRPNLRLEPLASSVVVQQIYALQLINGILAIKNFNLIVDLNSTLGYLNVVWSVLTGPFKKES